MEGCGTRTQGAVIVPVQIAEVPRGQASTIEPDCRAPAAPRIEIELAEGRRLKIWDISSETLRAIIRDLVRPC